MLASPACPGGAQVSPNGPEFQVNTYTPDYQTDPAVAANGEGNFFVAWMSDASSDTDNYLSIQARIFDANGAPLSSEFQVNTYTTSWQADPAVAADGQGNFVVVWASNGSSGTDIDPSIQAQRFNADGTPLGGEFQVNTYTTGGQAVPAVAADGQGNFIVVWLSSTGTQSAIVRAQRFDATGAPLGGEFQVNTYSTVWSGAAAVAVAMGGQGNFVVAWQSLGSSGTDTDYTSILAQRFAVNGTPLGPEFQVNTYTTSFQAYVAAAADSEGNFVVVWQSRGSSGTDTDETSIQAQRFAADGVPLGGEFQVNTYTTSWQGLPAVAMAAVGDFVVAWASDGSNGSDSSGLSIQAHRYDLNGAPLGGEFQVNTYTTSHQFDLDIATDDSGNIAVTWESDGSGGTDSSG